MSNEILLRTLSGLPSWWEGCDLGLEEIHLSRYFTTVALADGSVGACMSYYSLDDLTLQRAETALTGLLKKDLLTMQRPSEVDRFLLHFVPDVRTRFLLLTSLMATVASAMSAPVLREQKDPSIAVSSGFRSDRYDGIETALIVGFGGVLWDLASTPGIKAIHVIDLDYVERRHHIDTALAGLAAAHADKTFTCSVSVTPDNVRSFDLLAITGSVLCNDTLPFFLSTRAEGTCLALTGQSASIYPKWLFEAGVDRILTTMKPRHIGDALRGDYSGRALRPWLEGGLPWIELSPKPKVVLD